MRRSNVLWCLCLGLATCLPRAGPADEPAGAAPKAAFDKLALTSSGGFAGTGSGKALTVDGKGKFTAKDRDKQRQGQLKPQELTQLSKLVAAVDWKKVKENYQGGGADFFQDDLAVTVAGRTHETHVSEEVERKTLPQGLRELLAYLGRLHKQYRP
jgi:hypothetical protein